MKRLAKLIAWLTDTDCRCAWVQVDCGLLGRWWERLDYSLALEYVGAGVMASCELIMNA